MLGPIGSQIVLLCWIPITLVFFMVLPPRRAMLISSIVGWISLPDTSIPLPGIPDYTKTAAVTLSGLIGTLVFDAARLFRFRIRWFDIPILVFTTVPLFTSLSNELGLFDGFSGIGLQCLEWLLPYWLGRIYLTDVESFRELGLCLIAASVCLIPFCLFEFKWSAVLQSWVYGVGVAGWEGARMGGFRPRVFFSTGLALGLWMNAASLVAWWYQSTGQFKKMFGAPAFLVSTLLIVISILCRATGATLLLLLGWGAMLTSVRTKTKWLMWFLLAIAPLYCFVRSTNLWSGQSLVQLMEMTVGMERADSLDYRLENDDLLIAKAQQRPWFGWGGWGRNRVYDETGQDITITDGYWIIVFGVNGFVGLASMSFLILLPPALFLRHFPTGHWKTPELAPVAVLNVILSLFLIDCLFNAMPNVIYVIMAGGLFNITPSSLRMRRLSQPTVSQTGSRSRSLEGTIAFYLAQGRAAKVRGDTAQARSAWLQALEALTQLTAAEPGKEVLRRQWCDCANDLAWLSVNCTNTHLRDPKLALSLAHQSTTLYPTNHVYLNTLAACYYRTADYPSADAILVRSIGSEGGGTAFDYVLRAMTLARLGNYDEAERCLAETNRLIGLDDAFHPELDRLRGEAQHLLERFTKSDRDMSWQA